MDELKIKYLVCAIIILIAAYIDIRDRRIPNTLTLPLIVFGFLINLLIQGSSGLYYSFLGFLLAGLPFLMLYSVGAMGGGDVKLMMGVGAVLQFQYTPSMLFYTFVFGGLVATVMIIKCHIQQKQEHGKMQKHGINPFKQTIPYGVAIAMGGIVTILRVI